MAYARRVFGADPKTKQEIALDVGYSPNVARSVATHIENKLGFNNAMAQLAHESGNLAMQVMHEFKGRGFDDFTNSELTNALTAIGGAWSKFNEPLRQAEPSASSNKLRTIVLQIRR
jgi:hypothetical protein